MLNLNYDRRHDILYVRKPFDGHSYGEENDEGIITYYSMLDDEITGIAILDFKKKVECGHIEPDLLPVKFDLYNSDLRNIVFGDTLQYKCMLA